MLQNDLSGRRDTLLQRADEAAFLGYGLIDLFTERINIKTGFFNARKLVPTESKAIADSLVRNGILFWRNPIPALVKADWIELESIHKDDSLGKKTPFVRFTETCPEGTQVLFCGGQHRREALRTLRDRALKDLKKITEARDGINGRVDKGKATEEEKLRLPELEEEIEKIEKLANAGAWIVKLYDIGALLFRCFTAQTQLTATAFPSLLLSSLSLLPRTSRDSYAASRALHRWLTPECRQTARDGRQLHGDRPRTVQERVAAHVFRERHRAPNPHTGLDAHRG